MEIDLLFVVIKEADWRNISQAKSLKTASVEEDGNILSFTGEKAEALINHFNDGKDDLMLIVIDPLRIENPIKRIKKDGFDFISVQDEVKMDAIIDKIKLQPDKKGKYSLNVKHFD